MKTLSVKQLTDKGITSPEAFADGRAGFMMPFDSRLIARREGMEDLFIDRTFEGKRVPVSVAMSAHLSEIQGYDLGEPRDIVKLKINDKEAGMSFYYFNRKFIETRMKELAEL